MTTAADPMTIITVVFESERHLLWLQARSLARYADAEFVGEIIVLDNTQRGIGERWWSRIIREYGQLAPLVRVVRAADVCSVPQAVGWMTQQVLKLEISRSVRTEQYVLLDAKNHCIDGLDMTFLRAEDGRPRANSYSYRTHPLRGGLERVLSYLGVDPEPHLDRFPATVTPFVLDTATVRDAVAFVEATSGRPFSQEFVRADLLEFFLYSGWIVRSGIDLDDAFEFHQRYCPTVWPRGATLARVSGAIEVAQRERAPMFSIHRRALARIDGPSSEALASFWVSVGLFRRRQEARAFIRSFRRAYYRNESVRKVREMIFRRRRPASPGE